MCLEPGANVAAIGRKFGIKRTTLHKRVIRAKVGGLKSASEEKRGGKNVTFTFEQERGIYDFIVSNWVNPGRPFINEDIQILAMSVHSSIHKATRSTTKLKVSTSWVTLFKKCWKLSTRRPGKFRRVTSSDPHDVVVFSQRLRNLLAMQNPDNVINFDELQKIMRKIAHIRTHHHHNHHHHHHHHAIHKERKSLKLMQYFFIIKDFSFRNWTLFYDETKKSCKYSRRWKKMNK